jgi:hypothetical protein
VLTRLDGIGYYGGITAAEVPKMMLTGSQLSKYRLIVMLQGIELEGKGLKMTRGRSCLAMAKQEFGWKGNREAIKGLLKAAIDELPNHNAEAN